MLILAFEANRVLSYQNGLFSSFKLIVLHIASLFQKYVSSLSTVFLALNLALTLISVTACKTTMQRRLINVHSYTLERKLVGTENRGLGTPPHSEKFF